MTTRTNGLLTDPRVREAYPVLKDAVYLNVGTYGIMPTPALEAFQAMQGEFERRGVASDHACGRETEETRQRLAALMGATPEEIAFTRNATDGINLVLAGLDWQPGDELIITDEEHEAINHPTMYLHNTQGVVIKRVSVSPEPAVMTARLEAARTARTRLAALSFVSCESGTRLPGKAISDWAREHGILSLLDGAQVSGAIKVNLREIGCDFYTSNGHKWMSAPKGTGFFYGQRESLPKLSPAHVGAGSLEKYDLATETAEPFTTGQRFEYGTRAWGLTAGWSASLDWFESLGWESVYAHVRALAAHFKERIQERPGLRLLTPEAAEHSAGLTTFVIEGHEAQKVSQAMREKHNIYLRVIPHYNAIRVSTAHFNNEEDIDKLMRGLEAYRTQ
jgi:selenocysteine lyase/cysteine desulfurase